MKIGIIGTLDAFANSVRALEIKKILEKKGHFIFLINMHHQKKEIPSIIVKLFNIYYRLPYSIKQYFIILQFILRANLIMKKVKNEGLEVLISETELDSFIFTKKLNCLTILDSPAPWIEELHYFKKISDFMYKKLRKIEIEIYSKVDHLTFHWQNYTNYVKKYLFNEGNIFICDYGCNVKPKYKRAKHNYQPRVMFLGNLDGPWNNLELLSILSKKYPIDVYGGPEPDKKYNINYKGYAPTTDIISKYQFGLITITKDKLRRSSFSSKHLKYLEYGLPVLTPNWRKDPLLDNVSIYYDEDNFLDVISEYSDKSKWQKISDLSYEQAKKWGWNEALKPLLEIINDYSRKIDKKK